MVLTHEVLRSLKKDFRFSRQNNSILQLRSRASCIFDTGKTISKYIYSRHLPDIKKQEALGTRLSILLSYSRWMRIHKHVWLAQEESTIYTFSAFNQKNSKTSPAKISYIKFLHILGRSYRHLNYKKIRLLFFSRTKTRKCKDHMVVFAE